MKRFAPKSIIVAVVVGLALSLTPASAHADDSVNPDDTLGALQSTNDDAVSSGDASQAVLEDAADPSQITTASDGSLSVRSDDAVTTVPSSSDGVISIGQAEVGLPAATTAAPATRLDDAVVSFDHGDGSTTAPVVKEDASVQITTIISNSSAPTTYDYALALPEGAALAIDEAGIVTATAGDAFLLGVAPAWAVDANGVAVPTHYEIDGTTLRQVVDHTAGAYAYPIVADPWLGRQLFSAIWIKGTFHYSMRTSAWGRAIQIGGTSIGWAAGQWILQTAGWDEVTSKYPVLRSRPTYKQQYDCHVLGAYTPASGGTEWDLEGWRANRPWWRTDGGAYPWTCNWP